MLAETAENGEMGRWVRARTAILGRPSMDSAVQTHGRGYTDTRTRLYRHTDEPATPHTHTRTRTCMHTAGSRWMHKPMNVLRLVTMTILAVVGIFDQARGQGGGGGARQRQRQTDRQTDRQTEKDRQTDTERTHLHTRPCTHTHSLALTPHPLPHTKSSHPRIITRCGHENTPSLLDNKHT